MRHWTFHDPAEHDPAQHKSVVCGVWVPPGETIEAQCSSPRFAARRGPHWGLFGSHNPYFDSALVSDTDQIALGFRGSLFDPALNETDTAGLGQHWQSPPEQHNGVFAAALIDKQSGALTLISDATGTGPLYWRSINGAVLFATCPDRLTLPGDQPDPLSWRVLAESGYMIGHHSLYSGIERVPPGVCLSFADSTTPRPRRWLDPARDLPPGDEPLDDASIQAAEEAFSSAVGRALKIARAHKTILPLSSGWDSRRLLAQMQAHDHNFQTMSVRRINGRGQDVDAAFAGAIADACGVPFACIEPRFGAAHAADDAARRGLVGAETGHHDWAIPLVRPRSDEALCFIDGLGGDVLYESGFELDLPAGSHADGSGPDLLINTVMGKAFAGQFKSGFLPGHETAREAMQARLSAYPANNNWAEHAFLLTHTGRSTALWGTQLPEPGHLVIAPYLELDHLKTLLRFDPSAKFKLRLQRACLEKYWPDLASFPGSRQLPPDLAAPYTDALATNLPARFARLRDECDSAEAHALIKECLGLKDRVLLGLCFSSGTALRRLHWRYEVLLRLVSHHVNTPRAWTVS